MYNSEHGNYHENLKTYQEIIKEFPHIGQIMDILTASYKYNLGYIWEREDGFVFYFNGSMEMYFNKSDKTELLNKYKTLLQSNFGGDYNYNISINKAETI